MWEDIIKRRPLKINKPQNVPSPEEIEEIKERAVFFLQLIKMIEMYMEYLKPLSDGRQRPEITRGLNYALSNQDYIIRVEARTRSTRRLILSDREEISLIELFNNLYDIILKALDELPDSDRDTLQKVVKEFNDFLNKHEGYLVQQNKLYLAERSKLFG